MKHKEEARSAGMTLTRGAHRGKSEGGESGQVRVKKAKEDSGDHSVVINSIQHN